MRRIVIDVDGTICNAINRDYANALPIQPVIDKINYLFNQGYTIILYSSRGMASCNGDLSLILERNENTLRHWLSEHKVQFHELIFGKPLGDWYVDDKAMSVQDFVCTPFVELKGGSGDSVRREGTRVIKQGKSAKMQFDWYQLAKEICPKIASNIPDIYGFTVDTLYMEYITGISANLVPLHFNFIVACIETIATAKVTPACDLQKYCRNILSHIDSPWTQDLCGEILSHEEELRSHASFCHGDPTLSNCIIGTYGESYLIDPNYKDDYNSYLIDFSKLRMSLNGFEENLNLHDFARNSSYKKALHQLDKYLAQRGLLSLVKLLEIANWVRLHNFRRGEEQEYADNKAKELWKEYRNENK